MRPLLAPFVLMLALAAPAAAQHGAHHGHAPSSAAGTLSPEETADLLAGAGMGLARAAELNGYPGPKHVLELADSLAITPTQRATAERLFADVQREARALGAEVVALENELTALFAGGEATAEAVDVLAARLGEARGRLRAVHLKAHIAMREALTPAQIADYNRLRGHTD